MFASEHLQSLSQADEAHGKSTMLQDFCNGIIWTDIIRINPYALSHQEWVVASTLGALYLEAVEKLTEYQLNNIIKFRVELLQICFAVFVS